MFMTPHPSSRKSAAATLTRDRRHLHHSPGFWIGVGMFMLAILTYVLSEDLSLRPRPPAAAPLQQTPP